MGTSIAVWIASIVHISSTHCIDKMLISEISIIPIWIQWSMRMNVCLCVLAVCLLLFIHMYLRVFASILLLMLCYICSSSGGFYRIIADISIQFNAVFVFLGSKWFNDFHVFTFYWKWNVFDTYLDKAIEHRATIGFFLLLSSNWPCFCTLDFSYIFSTALIHPFLLLFRMCSLSLSQQILEHKNCATW